MKILRTDIKRIPYNTCYQQYILIYIKYIPLKTGRHKKTEKSNFFDLATFESYEQSPAN
jgi:hypothetical protein